MQRFLPRLQALKNAADQIEAKENAKLVSGAIPVKGSFSGAPISEMGQKIKAANLNKQNQRVLEPNVSLNPLPATTFNESPEQLSYAQMPNFGIQQSFNPVNYSNPGTFGNMPFYTPSFDQEQAQTMSNMQTGNQTLGGMSGQVSTGIPDMQGRLYGAAAGTPKQLQGATYTGQRAFPIEGDTFENNQNRPQMSAQDIMANLYKFRR